MNVSAARIERERAGMAAAGLVPIPLEPADEGCEGKTRAGVLYGACLTCWRYGREGEQLEPALRLVSGTAQCPNWRSTEPVLLGGDRVHLLRSVQPEQPLDKSPK